MKDFAKAWAKVMNLDRFDLIYKSEPALRDSGRVALLLLEHEASAGRVPRGPARSADGCRRDRSKARALLVAPQAGRRTLTLSRSP